MIMRIATKTMFDHGMNQLSTLQTSMSRTQQQLATGRRNLAPSDDPIATARALEVTQSQSINTQLVTNRQNARSSLSLEENALASATSLLQDVKTLAVNAGNGSMTNQDRQMIAVELQGRFDDMMGVANTADGVGGYLFSGYKDGVPFTRTGAGAAYQGDQGSRTLQVGSNRTLPISDSGASIFENNPTGNGSFQTGADPANMTRGGTGVIAPGSVTDTAALTNHQYEINFSVVKGSPGVPDTTTYTITDVTLGQPVPANPNPPDPIPYTSGQSIAFDGMQFDIKGVPADGDKFTVNPSNKKSVFETMQDLINALKADGSGPAGQANLTNLLNTANSNIDNALDNVLSVRAAVGSRLKEMDYLDSAGDDLNVQYATTLSDLQDVDTVKAISQFTQQQISLDAAQKSYKTLTSMSLFNYIT